MPGVVRRNPSGVRSPVRNGWSLGSTSLTTGLAPVIWKAYENDGVPFPTDAVGVIEGQRVCQKWGARQAFGSGDKFADYAQYTDTAAGEFW